MRVLGFDPGLRVTGYGCVDIKPGGRTLVEGGVIRLVTRDETPPIAPRLVELEREAAALIERLAPELVAVERLFVHAEHVETAVKMGHARGVLLLAAARASQPIAEVSPAEVKAATAASGRASKGQMQESIQRIFGLAEPPKPADVADALAIALCAGERAGSASLESRP
ncbi:MAG: crossover junction endodeoxyribonuclease RuvC [Planctomycetota bacterium]